MGKKEETVIHLASGCPKLAQKQYKRRHGNVSRRVHGWKAQTGGTSIHLLMSWIILGSYYPDSGTQQVRYQELAFEVKRIHM